MHRRREQRTQIQKQRFQLGLIEHRGLDQQHTCPARDEGRIVLDLPLDFVRLD